VGGAVAFHGWKANLRILEVTEVKTVPYVPLSHPFVERLIGTIRREFLHLVPFCNAHDLERNLHAFQVYYNRDRVHRELAGAVPDSSPLISERNVVRLDTYRWKPACLGLYQLPIAA
jgi:transposase InsO family protein